jgi:chromosome segregation ATPase
MTTQLEKAERDINNLEEQKEALIHRSKSLSKQRDQIAFAALTAGDKASKEKLREINLEDVTLAANIASVEAALTVARSNLKAAQQAEVSAADRTNALKLRERLAKFRELGAVLDDCFTDFKSAGVEIKQVLDDIHNLGCIAPSSQLFKVNCDLAFKTAVQGTPFWSQDFPALAPNQRKTFGSLVNSWSDTIENNIAQRLGDEKQQKVA